MSKFFDKFQDSTSYNSAKKRLFDIPHVSLISSTQEVMFDPEPEKPELVDLGLSVKWAKWNLGAATETEFGNYYAWGETETKSDYSWETYSRDFVNGTYVKYTNERVFIKYCSTKENIYWAGSGAADNKLTLEAVDDVVTVSFGGNWRMPTYTELTELGSLSHTIKTINGVTGCEFTGNGNTLFLPAAGYYQGKNLIIDDDLASGSYLSSSLDDDYVGYASALRFNSDGSIYYNSVQRCTGRPIRPVYVPSV